MSVDGLSGVETDGSGPNSGEFFPTDILFRPRRRRKCRTWARKGRQKGLGILRIIVGRYRIGEENRRGQVRPNDRFRGSPIHCPDIPAMQTGTVSLSCAGSCTPGTSPWNTRSPRFVPRRRASGLIGRLRCGTEPALPKVRMRQNYRNRKKHVNIPCGKLALAQKSAYETLRQPQWLHSQKSRNAAVGPGRFGAISGEGEAI